MLVFDVTMAIEENGKTKFQVETIEVAVEVAEMTYRQWIDYHLLVANWPEWLREFAEKSRAVQHKQSTNWTASQQSVYWFEIAKIVQNFCVKGSIAGIMEMELFDQATKASRAKDGEKETNAPDASSLEAVARLIFENLATYKPQERSEFLHKGIEFIVPESEIQKVGDFEQRMYLPKAKVGEVIEALQRQHVYGVKDENGEDYLKDKRYHTDLAMVACICRIKNKDGSIEKIPLGMEAFSGFVDRRMKLLEDLGADIAIDISFFLLNSYRRLLRMAMSDLPSNQGTARDRRKRRLKKRKR